MTRTSADASVSFIKGNPGTDLEKKAAAKILKYRELYRDRRRQIDGKNS